MLRACWAVGSTAPLPSPVGLSSFPSLSPNFVFGFNHVINSPGAAAHPGGAQGCVSMQGEVMFVLSQLGGLDNLQRIAPGGCGLPVPVAGFSCSLAPGWVSPHVWQLELSLLSSGDGDWDRGAVGTGATGVSAQRGLMACSEEKGSSTGVCQGPKKCSFLATTPSGTLQTPRDCFVSEAGVWRRGFSPSLSAALH